ncbi:MAG TPA: hypothetical protein VNF71_03035 [Acidimicrobiales bacterium]|nr:hypothetical protein [Acidimicrobiales bacterium]
MTVICLGSARSCGVTTLALALAATWSPERPVLLVEADPVKSRGVVYEASAATISAST